MSADDTKISAASAFDSVKNYENPTAQSATFSGSIGALSSQNHTLTFTIDRDEGAIGSFLFNYIGSPNDSSLWFFGTGTLRWGIVTLDGGVGDVEIRVVPSYSNSQFSFILSALNPDVSPRNIATPVVATIRPAFFIAPFA